MDDFKEVIPPDYFDQLHTPSEEKCPKCSGKLYHGPISCPDGKMGCLVLHYGYTCKKCGGMFTKG